MVKKSRGRRLITSREFKLAIVLGILGFVLNTSQWILFLNGLNPFYGLAVYYVILYVSLFVLSRLGLTIFGVAIKNVRQTVGLLLITAAFFICINWESPYVQYVTQGSLGGASNVFYGSEDGAAWYLWSLAFPGAGLDIIRFLAFCLSPFLLALVGGYLLDSKPRFG
jgi:hypothetical protein